MFCSLVIPITTVIFAGMGISTGSQIERETVLQFCLISLGPDGFVMDMKRDTVIEGRQANSK